MPPTEYGYDNRNRLIKIIQHNTDGTKNYTQYHYDAVGNKTKMYTGLNAPINTATETGADTDNTVTRYQYNHQNQMTTMTDPLEQTTQNTYDMVGNLIKQTDRNGNIITYQYNGQGKLLNKKVTKDGQTKQITYTYDKLGNRKSMTDETGTTTYSYDDLSRLKTENAPNNITKEYTYDAVSNRLTFTLKQNGTVKQNISYTYDTLNRQKQVKENGTTKATYTYDTNGNRQTLTYDNSNSTTYVYNDANRLTNITNKKGTTKQTEYNYTYYLNGNQASKTDNNGTTTYQYDGLGRLTAVTEPNSITTTYTFDDNSNRKTKTTTEGTTIAYTYDKNNRLLTETKVIEGTTENEIAVTLYEYDNNGNQVKKITDTKAYENQSESFDVYVAGKTENSIITSNEYDGFNQLTKTTDETQTITYKYNGDGLRTRKTTNGNITNHIWDGSNIVIETDGAGNITKKYLRGINLIASDIEGTTNYYLYNGHGDVVQLTQTNGTITKNYDYDAFGIEKDIDQNDTNPFRYCGEYYDTETGTIYLRARYYNPSVGRFISEDPIGDGLNWYTYAGNNPIMFIDPTGLYEETIKHLRYMKNWLDKDPYSINETYYKYYNNKFDGAKLLQVVGPFYDVGTTVVKGVVEEYQPGPWYAQLGSAGMGALKGAYEYLAYPSASQASYTYKDKMEYITGELGDYGYLGRNEEMRQNIISQMRKSQAMWSKQIKYYESLIGIKENVLELTDKVDTEKYIMQIKQLQISIKDLEILIDEAQLIININEDYENSEKKIQDLVDSYQ